jgi:ATP phosphoribosyltransferase
MTALAYVMISYNIPRDLLSEAVKITPGKKAPTISALDGDVAVSVSALVPQKDQSAVMDQLEAVGATDILIFTIANSRM